MTDKPDALNYHVRVTKGSSPTKSVMIFAHGIQTGTTFSLNSLNSKSKIKYAHGDKKPLLTANFGDKVIYFYIQDGKSLRYLPQPGYTPFERLANDELMPTNEHSSTKNDSVPDYMLTKAVGEHLVAYSGGQVGPSYEDIKSHVDKSRSSTKIDYDVATIRNRLVNGGTKLSSVISELIGSYDSFHCIFCRHEPGKKIDNVAPKLKPNVIRNK